MSDLLFCVCSGWLRGGLLTDNVGNVLEIMWSRPNQGGGIMDIGEVNSGCKGQLNLGKLLSDLSILSSERFDRGAKIKDTGFTFPKA